MFELGGLMFCGPNFPDLFRPRAADEVRLDHQPQRRRRSGWRSRNQCLAHDDSYFRLS